MKESLIRILRAFAYISVFVSTVTFTFYRGLSWRGFDPGVDFGADPYSFDFIGGLLFFVIPILIILLIKIPQPLEMAADVNQSLKSKSLRHDLLKVFGLVLLSVVLGYLGSWAFIFSAFSGG